MPKFTDTETEVRKGKGACQEAQAARDQILTLPCGPGLPTVSQFPQLKM